MYVHVRAEKDKFVCKVDGATRVRDAAALFAARHKDLRTHGNPTEVVVADGGATVTPLLKATLCTTDGYLLPADDALADVAAPGSVVVLNYRLVDCSDEEWELRVRLAACYRIVDLLGWADVIYNHVTVRVPGKDKHFLINPYGLRFEEVTAASLIKVDLDGNVVVQGSTDYPVNKAGFVIHSAIHAGRADAHCVLHFHTVPIGAVMASNRGLLPLNQINHIAAVPGVSYHEYWGIAVNEDERKALQDDLGPTNKVMLLYNHGVLTVGETLAEAFLWMWSIHRACEMQTAALSTMPAGEVKYPSAAVIDSAKALLGQVQNNGMGTDLFNALIRKVGEIDPSFGYHDIRSKL